jgi:hypothetical protein
MYGKEKKQRQTKRWKIVVPLKIHREETTSKIMIQLQHPCIHQRPAVKLAKPAVKLAEYPLQK